MFFIINHKSKDKIIDFLYRVYENRWLKSIRYGLLIMLPFILINCVLSIVIYSQSVFFNDFYINEFLFNIFRSSQYTYAKIYSFSRVMLLLTVSYSLAKIKNKEFDEKINPAIVAIIGFLSAIIITNEPNTIVSIQGNSKWVFSRIIISIVFTEVFMYLYTEFSRRIKLLNTFHDHILKQSIFSFVPAFMIICILVLFNSLITNNAFDINTSLIEKYLTSQYIYNHNKLLTILHYFFDTQVYWFMGGHGGDIVDPIIFGRSYLNVFCNIGGAGSTICLILAILISNINKYKKSLAKLSVLPCIFNINEIIVYGLPVILNPIYIIPFISTPMVLVVITKIMIYMGFISINVQTIDWMTPILLNSYIVTQSFNGIILQIINIIIGTLIYIPFVQLSSKIYDKKELVAYESLKDKILLNSFSKNSFTKSSDETSQIANILISDLSNSLSKSEDIYLEYQPQVDKNNKVVGVESLLRWNHKDYGNIIPIIAITLSEEVGLIHELGKWIIKESCSQVSKWNKELDDDIYMSINVSSTQLKDVAFASYLKSILDKYNINPNYIKLEITESLALGDDLITKNQLNQLVDLGIKLVIDDFGVGYNPILYIKKYKIDTIKIDGSLIRDIDVSEDSRNIVKAMYNLCENSGIKIINEFVETYEQKCILDNMGDGIYQGYYFSKPLKPKECLEYIKKLASHK